MKSNAYGEVLRTCKQLHGEGTPILYGESTFCTTARDIYRFGAIFLKTIRPEDITMIKEIKIHFTSARDTYMVCYWLPQVLRYQPGLQSLRRLIWEIDYAIWAVDSHSKCDCMMSAFLSMQQLPKLTAFIGVPLSEVDRKRNILCCIMEDAAVDDKQDLSK